MSRTLSISDALYTRLEAIANARGLQSVEELLAEWQPDARYAAALPLREIWPRYAGRVSGRTYNAVARALEGPNATPIFKQMTWGEFLQQARRPNGGMLQTLYLFGDVALSEVRRICHDVPPLA